MSVEIRVRGYHLDVYQHVNNGRYLEFLEEARWEYMGRTGMGASLDAAGMAMVIVNININYRLPAVIGDLLRVTVDVTRVGNKSATLTQLVNRVDGDGSETTVVDAEVTFCVMDRATEKALPLEGQLRDLLTTGAGE